MENTADLRLSCIAAFLDRIQPNVRLIKIRKEAKSITVTVVLDTELLPNQLDLIQVATAEIIADFPDCNMIKEDIKVSRSRIEREGHIQSGWIYRRYED